jgi:hypothetical protein
MNADFQELNRNEKCIWPYQALNLQNPLKTIYRILKTTLILHDKNVRELR